MGGTNTKKIGCRRAKRDGLRRSVAGVGGDAALETISGYERRMQAKAKPHNEQLPAHLPRYEGKLEVAEDQLGLVEGNRYDTSVAAGIMIAKYAYHLPVYRQQDLFASHGWTPARSTLLNVLEAAAHLIRPLVVHLWELVRAGPIIGSDDTPVTLVVKDSALPGDDDNPKNMRAREVIAAAQTESQDIITARPAWRMPGGRSSRPGAIAPRMPAFS